MRYFVNILVVAAMAAMTVGCASHKHAECGCKKTQTKSEDGAEAQSGSVSQSANAAAPAAHSASSVEVPFGQSASRKGDGPWIIDGQPGIPCVMQSGGRDVLRLSVSSDTKCKSKDAALDLVSREQHIYIWMVKRAKTVADAVGRVPQEIKDEFKDFKATQTIDIKLAAAPAKYLVGLGTEADDGDPGHAEVIVFKAGDNVFLVCVHGEHADSFNGGWMLSVVETAQAP
ncbi:MAG: hypothetical protein HY287_04160 [Planctomycetes bacterium]|nr:hypothetical protein [Planctomycetota bacterium]MBI3833507.1 hypothetical protein [Planctomycetota bacterium]